MNHKHWTICDQRLEHCASVWRRADWRAGRMRCSNRIMNYWGRLRLCLYGATA